MANPWDIHGPSALDAKPDTVYTAVGRALSTWEELEQRLAVFFGFFMTEGFGSDFAARRAYGSVVTFRGRMELLQTASEAHFAILPDDDLPERFAGLVNKALKFSPRRNEIAHGVVSIAAIGERMEENPSDPFAGFGYLLMPSDYTTRKHTLQPREGDRPPRTSPRYLYSSADINAYTEEFREIGKEALGLMLYWGEKYPSAWPEPDW